MTTRPINEIAGDIVAAWGPAKIYFGAKPYLIAMSELESIDDMYGDDSARSVLLYFLANAQTFRGPVAKALKAEIKKVESEEKDVEKLLRDIALRLERIERQMEQKRSPASWEKTGD